MSALNRSAPVDRNGVWVLPNVPANLGQVRVRATCIKDGAVSFGASALMTVPANGVVKVEDIQFEGPPPIPSSLSLSAPETALTALGQTVQLSVVATYPGGSTANVSAAEVGTDYRTSNPAIATVDANGLVTARASGVALVSAVNEGVLGVIRFEVKASGDSDGDGLPDDWELANGLDPNNPVDALDDPDGDGLTTLAEYQAGFDPFNGDSDGDGLGDGREVNELGTNPLLADTDGDGLRDGLEVQTLSDPLDPNSFNLAAALESIEVAPGSFRLIFNTVIGEASRQLRITGRLIDGFSLDVTSQRYGTTFSSSDFNVAGFGPEDGRVYAGQDGTATITARNGSFSAISQAAVETFSPRALSFIALPGNPNNVALSGHYAFVASGSGGLQVVDVTDPQAPFVAGRAATPGNANDVRLVGDFAFVAAGRAGLVAVDVSQPQSPRIVGQVATTGTASDLVVTGGRAYVANEGGLAIIDVSNPSHPGFLGSVTTPGRARGVDVVEGLAVVAASDAGLQIVDVRNPARPVVVGSAATWGWRSNAADVVVRGRLAYVADGAESSAGGLRVVDFRDPANPVLIGSSPNFFALTSTALEQGLALGSDYFYANAVPIFDTGNVPQQRALLDFSGPPSFRHDAGHGLAVRDGLVYLAASNLIMDNGTVGDGGLHIGRYAILQDTGDRSPTAAITAPVAGTTAGERRRLLLRAEARDEVRVASVRFLVDGVTVFTDYDAPYEYSYLVPSGRSSLRIGAVAVDDGDNPGVAEEVAVTVVPNGAPVVTLLSPVEGQSAVGGGPLTLAAEASDDQAVLKVEFFVDGILRATKTAPPYRFDDTVPLSATSLSVTAIANDDAGPSAPAGPVIVPVKPDEPPTVAMIAPRNGEVTEGATVRVVAGVTDDVGIRQVQILVNGALFATRTSSPFEWALQAPTAGSSLRIQVVAEDTRLQRTSAPEVTVVSVGDRLTALRGRTVDGSGAPVPGARVETADALTFSGPDGVFSFSGLSTLAGDFSLTASAVIGGFDLRGSLPDPVSPVPGGIVNVGDLRMTRENPGAIVVGKTVDEAGTPVAGALVKVYDDYTVLITTSGPDGAFRVSGAPTRQGGVTVSATATVAGARWRARIQIEAFAGLVADAGAVVLAAVEEEDPDPLTTVIGFVTDGSPVPGAQVNVITPFDVFQTVTGPDGTFFLAGVPTNDGAPFVSASAVVDGVFLAGSRFVPTELGGTTDFGAVLIHSLGGGGKVLRQSLLCPLTSGLPAGAWGFWKPGQ